ncbi:MAG: hypothetical protein JSV65_09740 [Armatimonadota bacterium]|nr:MAG: hypothetical protein JSV65_09740 [Armatimonadota bacterium]
MDKRRKELLFLGAGLAVLLAALFFTFKPTTRPAQATTQPPPSATAREPSDLASARIESSAAPIPMSQGGTTAGRNPFAPVIAARPASAPGSAPPAMVAAMPPAPLPPIEPMRLELFGPPDQASPSGVITPAAEPTPAQATLRLTGVIYGDPSMAIIRKGDKRYFVRPGDPVGGRYMVQSIARRQVVLASSEGTLRLDLTGRL